jgi:hypothetical protein
MLERRDRLARLTNVAPEPSADQLDARARALLDFEREAWKLRIPKERAIRERFGFSSARYHQLLHRAVDSPHAVAYDPMLVRRIRRVREARRRRRVAGRLGLEI